MQPMTHEELESCIRRLPNNLQSKPHGKMVCYNITRLDGKKLKAHDLRGITKFCEEEDEIDKSVDVKSKFVRIRAKHMGPCRQLYDN